MLLMSAISRTPRLACQGGTYFSTLSTKLSGYHQLLQASDREKVQEIAKTFLPKDQQQYFISSDARVSPKELIELVDMVETTTKITSSLTPSNCHLDPTLIKGTDSTLFPQKKFRPCSR